MVWRRSGTGTARAVAPPLTLILARNLAENVRLAAFLTDVEGSLVFFNETAGELVGAPFEEVGPLAQEEWAERFGPFDADGQPAALDSLPLALTVREGRPSQGRFHVRTASDALLEVEVSALPLIAADGFHGALVLFWPAVQAAESPD
jgi:PAS domain-containing protein